jgi:osmotically-inducible protein OsmY
MLGLVGCASPDPSRTAGQYDLDKDLAARVKAALQAGPIYNYPNVKVSTYLGRVQLSGFVLNEGQRQEAGRIVQGVKGVGPVENSLLLAPAPGAPVVGQHSPDQEPNR